MATVRLRGQLRQLAGDQAEHEHDGATVADVLRELEKAHPDVRGWVLDERGRIRPHINVFVNGEPAEPDNPVDDNDKIEILPAISGG